MFDLARQDGQRNLERLADLEHHRQLRFTHAPLQVTQVNTRNARFQSQFLLPISPPAPQGNQRGPAGLSESYVSFHTSF